MLKRLRSHKATYRTFSMTVTSKREIEEESNDNIRDRSCLLSIDHTFNYDDSRC